MFILTSFFFSSRRRHTRCALVTGVQTCALPICPENWRPAGGGPMNFPRFFIDRPIFAIVLSVLLLIAGLLALLRLPLSEYPAVAPPTVTVVAAYPGASPDVIAETVASPIEQAVNGVEGMLYMASQEIGRAHV